MTEAIAGVSIPDSPLATEATALLREAGTPLLLDHSLRSFLFGSVQGHIQGQSWDPELLYLGAIFHDLGLTEKYRSAGERFEIDGANAASAFLHEHDLPEDSVGAVWDAVALHTTFGIPAYKRPEISLLQSGVVLDVLGFGFDEIPGDAIREITAAYPRDGFKEGMLHAFVEGIKHKPQTAFGNVKSDVLEDQLPGYVRPSFVDYVRRSPLED